MQAEKHLCGSYKMVCITRKTLPGIWDPKIWSLCFHQLKIDSLANFKTEIKRWQPSCCSCRLCKSFIQSRLSLKFKNSPLWINNELLWSPKANNLIDDWLIRELTTEHLMGLFSNNFCVSITAQPFIMLCSKNNARWWKYICWNISEIGDFMQVYGLLLKHICEPGSEFLVKKTVWAYWLFPLPVLIIVL